MPESYEKEGTIYSEVIQVQNNGRILFLSPKVP